MIHYYDTDIIEITPDLEPQVAVLKFLGVNEKPTQKEKNMGLITWFRKSKNEGKKI